MDARTLRSSTSRARILAAATRNIAEVGFTHATRERIMAGTGLHPGSLDPHFGNTGRLLAVICNTHARALAEATGTHDAADPTPPRAALAATAARILACIDARPDAHTVLMRDLACLPPAVRAEIDYLGSVAAFQLDCAWSALRPDLADPARYAGLTRALRSLLLRWPDWRETGPAGHPDAAADRALAMVEATIDRAPPATARTPRPPHPALAPHAHWLSPPPPPAAPSSAPHPVSPRRTPGPKTPRSVSTRRTPCRSPTSGAAARWLRPTASASWLPAARSMPSPTRNTSAPVAASPTTTSSPTSSPG